MAWRMMPLGELCDVVNGGTPKTGVDEYWGGEHLWITPAEMGKRESPYADETERKITNAGLQNSSARLLPPHSVILSSRAPIGHLVINTEPMATNQGCKGLVPGPLIDHKYLFYFLGSIVDLLNALGTGATFRELSGGKLKEVLVPVPPLSEQNRIVAILDEAFEGIRIATANAEKNLANARELFALALADRLRGTADWATATVGEVCQLKSGHTLPATVERPNGDIPYLKVADMTIEGNEQRVTRSSRYVSLADIKPGLIIPEGATLFPKRGGAILTNKKRLTTLPICADLNLMAVIPGERIEAEFLYYYFLNIDMRELGSGSSIPQINNYDIAPLGIAFPEARAEQRAVVSRLAEIRRQTTTLEQDYADRVQIMGDLKAAILSRAFSGQLTATKGLAA